MRHRAAAIDKKGRVVPQQEGEVALFMDTHNRADGFAAEAVVCAHERDPRSPRGGDACHFE
jgi:hypothetical protein